MEHLVETKTIKSVFIKRVDFGPFDGPRNRIVQNPISKNMYTYTILSIKKKRKRSQLRNRQIYEYVTSSSTQLANITSSIVIEMRTHYTHVKLCPFSTTATVF